MTEIGWIRESWDRVVASDPGLQRLRMALSAALAMATTLGVEYEFGRWTHAGPQGVLVAMLLGTVMAMMGSMALSGPETWPKVRTAVFFPVAIGAGMLPGTVVAGHTDAMLVAFVAVMFVAVYIRRFGMPYFFYGFMIWMGYFFSAFLGTDMSDLPRLLAAVAVATAWILLLSLTVLRTHPRRTLRRVRQAFGARARAVARVSADLLVTPAGDERRRARLRRRLHSRQLRLAETALVIEGWSGHPGALPTGWSAPALRRSLLDAHLAIEELATAAEALVLADGRLADEAARITSHLARREYRRAEYYARALLLLDQVGIAQHDEAASDEAGGARPADCYAEHLAAAAVRYTAVAATADAPSAVDGAVEFEPAVTLALGNLPGSGAVAVDVPARGGWNPLSRMPLTTRQAVQVAVAGGLAIMAGRELSQARYYWAVIAAFIAFGGTATRSETFIKAGNRVVGTLLGLGAGVALAHLTAGHTIWALVAIVASMTCGFYLVTLSYACMIFFVTIMVAQLYSQLNEFSAQLLVLRLEETVVGAAIGIVVALLVLPTSTRDTVRMARGRYFTALAALLKATAARLGGAASADGAPADDQDALIRAVDLRLQQLALVARPLTRTLARPLIWGNDPRLVRHRITLYASLTRQVRALALNAGRSPDAAPDPELGEVCGALAESAAALAVDTARPGRPAPAVEGPLCTARTLLLSRPPTDMIDGSPSADRSLSRLRRLLHELAVLSPSDAARAVRPPDPSPDHTVSSGGTAARAS